MTLGKVLPPGETLPPLEKDRPRDGRAAPPAARGGRFDQINNFVDVTSRLLPRAALGAWLVLWRDSRDGVARVSMESIAARVGCTPRQVVRAVKQLENLGLVRVVARGGLARGPSTYQVTPVSPSQVTTRAKSR